MSAGSARVADEVERRASKVSAVRELLADGRMHCMRALREVGGDRFGARIFQVNQQLKKDAAPRRIRAFYFGPGHYHYALVPVSGSDAAPLGPQGELFETCEGGS